MDISGAAFILEQALKIAPAAGKAARSLINPEPGTIPQVRADAADFLSATQAPQRAAWTPADLFLYFAAFTRTTPATATASPQVNVSWIASEDEILDLLLRGRTEIQRSTALPILREAMADVPEMISLMARPTRFHEAVRQSRAMLDMYKPKSQRTGNRAWDTAMSFLDSINSFVSKPGLLASEAILNGMTYLHDRNLRLNILREIARCLTIAGLSSIEIKTVLLAQGLPEDDVLKLLLSDR